MRSGARHRALAFSGSIMLRQRYDQVGLPCRKTIGDPDPPVSTYDICESSTAICFRGWRSLAEIGCSAMGNSLHLPADDLFVDLRKLARQLRDVFDHKIPRRLAHLAQIIVAG